MTKVAKSHGEQSSTKAALGENEDLFDFDLNDFDWGEGGPGPEGRGRSGGSETSKGPPLEKARPDRTMPSSAPHLQKATLQKAAAPKQPSAPPSAALLRESVRPEVKAAAMQKAAADEALCIL